MQLNIWMSFISEPSQGEAQHPETQKRRKLRFLRPIGMLAAFAVALSGLGLSQASPAHAAPAQQQQWVFDSPSGTDWVVPAGITEVVVGLRGGTGGDGDTRKWGSGANFAVKLQVQAGDKLTVYAGKSAHGKKDMREGGAGFVSGGTGGKASLSGDHGGGGGGAAAVKLNGELVAVAGGGGGAGGASYKPTVKMSLLALLALLDGLAGNPNGKQGSPQLTHVPGGLPGSTRASIWGGGHEIVMSAPTSGKGSKPGAVGRNGVNDPKFSGYGKSGSHGGSAGTQTGGGGGGAGGGGWPASGTGGGAGRTFWHFSAGSGGGAGMSWVTDSVPGVSFDEAAMMPEDSHTYFGPLADPGTVKIFIPMTTTTVVTAPSEVLSGESIQVRVRTADSRAPQTPLDGSINLFREGVSSRIDYHSTGGDHTFTIPALPVGEYTFRAEFSPSNGQQHYREASTRSVGTVTVNVVDAAPAPVPEPVDVTTTTTVSLDNNPAVYGDLASFSGEVAFSGPFVPSLAVEDIEIDGAVVGQIVLIPNVAEGKYSTLLNFNTVLPAGTHSIVAKFNGQIDGDPTTPDVMPSVSEPLEVTIAQAPTVTTLNAPNSTQAFSPIDVSAKITHSAGALAEDFDGSAVLLAEGAPLMYANLSTGGSVLFEDVVIPWGTHTLEVAYLGDSAGNFEMSTSAASPIEVTAIDTVTSLKVSASEVRADDTVTITATVRNSHTVDLTDPRGMIEILLDGEVAYSIPAGLDDDPEINDGEAEFELDVSGLMLGKHAVTARFVPAPGFAGSLSDEVEMTVLGIATVLSPSATEIHGTPKHPAIVNLRAEVAPENGAAARSAERAVAGDPVDGYVQAFIGAEPYGEPVGIFDGHGAVELAGLPLGKHEIDLRFTPSEMSMLKASTVVSVTIAADEDAGEPSGKAGGGNGLSQTGASGPQLMVLGGSVLLLAAGLTIFLARRRQREDR